MNQEEAHTILLVADQPPAMVLRALRAEVGLSDSTVGQIVGKSPQTVRRWRRSGNEVVPAGAAKAIGDLQSIVAMLLRANFESRTIKGFLLSRNTGLGKDRPVDGLRVDIGELERIEYVTECFIVGVAPELRDALLPR